MIIFRTTSGAVYVIEELTHLDESGYSRASGFRVLRFSHKVAGTIHIMDQSFDDYHVDNSQRLVFTRDHLVQWTSTPVVPA